MWIRKKRAWELPESAASPESHFVNRRRLIAAGAVGSAILAAPAVLRGTQSGGETVGAGSLPDVADPSTSLYPVPRNPRFAAGRPITDRFYATTYNNFYEFGSHKSIAPIAEALPVRPWQVRLDGMVEKPVTLDIDDLLRQMPLEERIYRLRCVEAWSIVVPWSGFPMKALVDLARPLSRARYVAMETFMNPAVAPGQRLDYYPWPYLEGLTMAEATNELAFLVTGVYGKPLPEQNGAPLRLATPWKYGFKSIKSIVRFHFTDERPVSFWQKLAPREYGFWANVNPEVPHPRWSQATEEVIGTDERVPTQIYNGYGEFVAQMYQGLESEPLFT
jgi:sulfoxide reductase catalytic subunit YedY